MIFEALKEAADRGELLLVDGGMARVHLRRDGQLTLHEILSTRPGAGSVLLERLVAWPGASCIVARCPTDLAANEWYAAKGFVRVGKLVTRTGREVVEWRRDLS